MVVNDKKIIFAGPVGAGKTTAIRTLSDVAPIETDQLATDLVKERKSKTTVAMDYGLVKVNNREKIHLYGIPGQARFDFMWEILSLGGVGLVLLLDNTRKTIRQDMEFYIDAFQDVIQSQPLAVGISRMDRQHLPGINQHRQSLASLGLHAPLFEVDARSRRDMSALLKSLLLLLDS